MGVPAGRFAPPFPVAGTDPVLVWLPSLLFVVFILPARLLTGWAVGRALRRHSLSHGFFRWTSRLAAIPVVIVYVVFVYLSQYLSWNGSRGMIEQHAFLVPAPWASPQAASR